MSHNDQLPQKITVVRNMGTPDAKRWETAGEVVSETEVRLSSDSGVQPGDVIYLKADNPLSVKDVHPENSATHYGAYLARVESREPDKDGIEKPPALRPD